QARRRWIWRRSSPRHPRSRAPRPRAAPTMRARVGWDVSFSPPWLSGEPNGRAAAASRRRLRKRTENRSERLGRQWAARTLPDHGQCLANRAQVIRAVHRDRHEFAERVLALPVVWVVQHLENL